MAKYFNNNLKHIRQLKGLTQLNLAEKMNVDRSTISKWEKNEANATIDNAIEVAKILNIPIELLLGQDLSSWTLEDLEKNKNDYINKYSSLSHSKKELANSMIDALYKQENKENDK